MPAEKPKILIVEDETPLLNILATKLEKEGLDALKAKDGVEGLETALKQHPDMILLDILLPRMDGVSMLRQLREDPWGKHVPVLVLSNLSDNKQVSEALNLGAFDYLIKTNWDLEDVIKMVRKKVAKT